MLRHIVDVLRAALRANDKLFRWGGDEFLLVFPGADAPHVERRIKSILESAEPLRLSDGSQLEIRVSVGSAAYESSEKLEDAIDAADRAMYADKGARKRAHVAHSA